MAEAPKKKVSFNATAGADGKKAAAEGAKAPVVTGGRQELPPGITNGVADLVGCELQELDDKTGYKQLDGSSAKGQLVLVLTGAVRTPKTHFDNGSTQKVEGRQFKKWCPLFKKGARGDFGAEWSFAECVKQACNEMRKIAGADFDTSDFDGAVNALASVTPKPRFNFSTVMGKPSTKIDPKTGKPYPPRLNVYWNGSEALADEASAPNDPAAGVNDGTGGDDAGDGGDSGDAAFAGDVDGSGQTLEQLAELVDADEAAAGEEGTPEYEAAAKLSDAVTAAGKDDEWVSGFPNWVAVVAALREEQGGGDGATGDDDAVVDDDDAVVEDEPEPEPWKKGDECLYVPPVKGPGGKEKPGTKAVKCKVAGLNKAGTKATVIEVGGSKRKFENLPIDALTRPE